MNYEGTTKVTEAQISSLVNEYELYKMVDNESVESMFSRFCKIVIELKSVWMVYSNSLSVSKLVNNLHKAWETKVVILKVWDLQNMTYDELQGNLMAYEENHINRYNNDDEKKTMAFIGETLQTEEEADENHD